MIPPGGIFKKAKILNFLSLLDCSELIAHSSVLSPPPSEHQAYTKHYEILIKLQLIKQYDDITSSNGIC